MVNFLNSWTNGIVVAVIIGSVIEMILPEGNNKKYVKIVIGVFILFTIISPVISKFTGGVDLSNIIKYEEYINTVTVTSTNVINNSDVLSIYKKKLSNEIKNTLENNGFKVNSIDLYINSKDENYGEILKIILKVEKNNNKVETINISNGKVENSISNDSKNKIKELLNALYGISKDRIIF